MKSISITVDKFVSIIPGLTSAEELTQWLRNPNRPVQNEPNSFKRLIPVMTSRRLDKGSLFAAEAAARIFENDSPSFIVFSSRHGELSKGEKILSDINQEREVSPADFSYSVHNSASGVFSIAKHITVPVSSIAAGEDSFHSALIDAAAALEDGAQSVLAVDFENILPPFLGQSFLDSSQDFSYAVAFLLKKGNEVSFSPSFLRTRTHGLKGCAAQDNKHGLPPSLQFTKHYLLQSREFETAGGNSVFTWNRHE